MSSSSNSIFLSQISVRHPHAQHPALHAISLQIEAVEQVAIIGPSGAGKTTLLHTLALAHQPSDGELTWMAQQPWQMSSHQRHGLRKQLFLAPQTPPLPPRQRVVTAVLAGRLPQWSWWQAVRNLFKPIAARDAWLALMRFHLQDKLYWRVDRLSGGERQRCALARLLVSDARVLLVDEPLSALDPALAQHTLQVLQDEARQRNATLVCSLHQVDLARAHFSRIVGLRDGRIVFDSTSPSDAMIADLFRGASKTEEVNTESIALPGTCCPDDPRCF
ncbi:MAG: ATP-binding cassette domain-containing protein [Burkholderiales bacterium]|nr:ATP-binding cassette domain-containing protein [Burkholderiales bacterium]